MRRLEAARAGGMGSDEGIMAKQSRGTIADTLASARASLKNPSRPFTPADPQRRLHGSLASPSMPRPPPTPLVNLNSVFEAERPFTSMHNALRPPTKPLGTAGSRPLSRAGMVSPLKQQDDGSSSSLGARGSKASYSGADILSLDDDPVVAGAHRADPGASLPRAAGGAGGGSLSARSMGGAGGGDDAGEAWFKVKALLGGLSGDDTFGMCDCVDRINDVLADPAAVKQLNSSQRSEIVKSAAKVLDSKDSKLVAKLGSLILRITKGGANLLSVSKLLFKLSKTPSNDVIFLQEGLCEGILKALGAGRIKSITGGGGGEQAAVAGMSDLEAAVYLWGALKNMSVDFGGSQSRLLQHGAFKTLADWMRGISKWRGELGGTGAGQKARDVSADVLVQAASVFRNLAASPEAKETLGSSGAIEAVCQMMRECTDAEEVLLTSTRVLSKVSVHETYRSQLLAGQVPERLVCSMQQHPSNLPLNIRCCFVLGNLTAADEQQRIDLAQLKGGVSTLMGLLSTHTKVVLGEHQSPSQRRSEGGDSSEDLLVKLVRTIAHMAISPTAGPELACHESIENLVKLLEHVDASRSEELVLNVVSAITNLSYYDLKKGVMCTCRSAISHGLAPMLFLDNEEAVLEAARAFGNLSRDSGTRAIMHTTRVDEAMVLLLDHKKRDVVAAVAGVLVNLSVDKKCAGTIVDTDGIATLIDTIERAGLDDAELATTLCHALFNLCSTLEWQLDDTAANVLLALCEEVSEAASSGHDVDEQVEGLVEVMGRIHQLVLEHCLVEDAEFDDDQVRPAKEENLLEPLPMPEGYGEEEGA